MTKEEWKDYRATHAYQISMSQHKKYEKNKEKYRAYQREYEYNKRRKRGCKEQTNELWKNPNCATCKHFIRRERTVRNSMIGMCELSEADKYNWEKLNLLRRLRKACKKYERE